MMRGVAAHIRKLGDVLAGTHLFCSSLVLLPVLLQLFVDTLKEKMDKQWLQSNSGRSACVHVCVCVRVLVYVYVCMWSNQQMCDYKSCVNKITLLKSHTPHQTICHY